jgi:hypothetical protein
MLRQRPHVTPRYTQMFLLSESVLFPFPTGDVAECGTDESGICMVSAVTATQETCDGLGGVHVLEAEPYLR